ncbi:MAG: ECF-type sigma factor [Planctomycetota bacterium]
MTREITEILGDINDGRHVQDELFEHVYDELKSMAENQMRSERSDHTLQSTALVNEAYLRLTNGKQLGWQNRRHFFAAAAESMRRVLVDSARARGRQKRGGKMARLELVDDQAADSGSVDPDQLLDLERHLHELESESPELAELVKLRFFAGLSMQVVANCLDTSLSTVERRWRFARAWLAGRMNHEVP